MNNYTYAQPYLMYPPQGYNTQAIPGFQQYASFPAPPAQSAPSPDGMKSTEVTNATAQNLAQNVAMCHLQQNSNQLISNPLMNNQSSLTFEGQIHNIQTLPAGTRPAISELPSDQNQFNQQQLENKANSQLVGNPPVVPGIQQINHPPTTLCNYPVKNYPGIPQSHVASLQQPCQNQTACDPANAGHNLQVENQTSRAQIRTPVGPPSNFISPGNSQQVPGTDVKPSGNFQTSIASNKAANLQGLGGAV